MKRILFFSLILIFLTLPKLVWGDDIEFKASINAEKIGLEDLLVYTLTIKGISNPVQPELDFSPNFVVNQTSRSSEFRYINGVASNYVNFIYYLRPMKMGQFTLPSLKYQYRGKEYETGSFRVTVVQGRLNPTQPRSRWQDPFDSDFFSSPFRKRQQQPQEIDVKIKYELSKKQVFRGEQVIFKIILYSANQIESVNMLSNQSFPGFWQEWFPIPRTISGKRIQVGGKQYQQYVIRKVALFPSNPGTVTIPALRFQLSLVENGISFFSNARNIIRSTPAVEIQVSNLPPEAKGLPVGNFLFSLAPKQTETDINDILTIMIKINGKGNIKTINIPSFKNTEDYKVYPAKISKNFDYGDTDLQGRIEAEIPVTFNQTGTYIFPALTFSYFDPKSSQIVKKSSEPFSIKVSGKKEKQSEVQTVPQTKIVRQGEDIDFIRKGTIFNQQRQFYQSPWFYVLFSVPFLFIIIFLFIVFILKRLIAESRVVKKKKLINATIKRLKGVTDYGEIFTILENYLSEKTGLGLSEINNQRIQNLFDRGGVPGRDISTFIELKSKSESSRFSPQTISSRQLHQDLKILIDILKKVDNKLE